MLDRLEFSATHDLQKMQCYRYAFTNPFNPRKFKAATLLCGADVLAMQRFLL